MYPLRSRQGIVWEPELHLPSAPLAWGGTRGSTLLPPALQRSQGWKYHREDGEDAGGVFLQLIPPMPRWGQPALVAASGKGDEEGVRRFLGSLS